MGDVTNTYINELVKKKLTEEVANCVHAIQQSYEAGQTPVVSDNSGEQLAQVIEAILLHGLRPNNWASKLSSAFGISKNTSVESTNFWDLVTGFSHRDVIQRIEYSLIAQNDTGRCRMWLRLAFNDSLIESYITAITSSGETVESFYMPGAFMRDKEALDVLYSLLLGLQNFAFHLPVEKTEYNKWERHSLVLAGLLPDIAAKRSPPRRSNSRAPSSPSPRVAEGTVNLESDGDTLLIGSEEVQVVSSRAVRPRSTNSPTPNAPPPTPLPLSLPLPNQNGPNLTIDDRDDELAAILRVKLESLPSTESSVPPSNEVTPTSSSSNPSRLTQAVPLDKEPPSHPLDNEPEEEASESYNRSGNLVTKNSGWSSSFEEAEPILRPGPRLKRKDRQNQPPEDSFDTVLERGMAISYGVSGSLGIGSSLFARMVDEIQTASSSDGMPEFSVASEFEHDFEVLNADQFVTTKSVEGKKRELLVRIPVEKGLRAQHYKCGGCGRPIGALYGNSKLCNFDLLYYCTDCHVDDELVIPSRVIHNWDFRKYKVCKRAKELIEAVESAPLFDMHELNPKIHDHVKDMEECKKQRIQLQIVKSYLWTCKKETCEQFNSKLWPHDHLHETVHFYAISDLILVHNGTLLPKIRGAIQFGIDHIRKCFLCSQRGFICEVCRSGQVLHAFDTNDNYQCLKCYAVFHKKCMNEHQPCPKCQRRLLQLARRQQSSESSLDQ
ncbi:hypothetical protein RvY_11353 [Ramazzottius varieornatus]|uniref:RUN domain-containing protein n=1 Tax=Ramazzottius varieornatus TaxID=947166 RepID=A0A1D1VPP6_RAMVA|nr:hypothetical protein RvY_11353 [Ramazzottius varieornatus]